LQGKGMYDQLKRDQSSHNYKRKVITLTAAVREKSRVSVSIAAEGRRKTPPLKEQPSLRWQGPSCSKKRKAERSSARSDAKHC